jgi:hypothetical protein
MSVVSLKAEIAVRLGIPASHDLGYCQLASFMPEGPGSLFPFRTSERFNIDVRPVHRPIPLCKQGS